MYQLTRRSMFVMMLLIVAITAITFFTLNLAVTPSKAADADLQALLTDLSQRTKIFFSVRSVNGTVYPGGDITAIGSNYVCFKKGELNFSCLPYYTILRVDYGNK